LDQIVIEAVSQPDKQRKPSLGVHPERAGQHGPWRSKTFSDLILVDGENGSIFKVNTGFHCDMGGSNTISDQLTEPAAILRR